MIFALTALNNALATTLHDDGASYSEALSDLSSGQTRQAIEKLSAILQRHPNHHGALLDLALAHCQAGMPADAETLFARLEATPELPPAISEVIKFYRNAACNSKPLNAWQTFLAAGMGRAHNLNQAPGIGFLYLAPLGITLRLADSSRPQNDSFFSQEITVSRPPPDQGGWGGGIFLQRLDYAHENTFDSTLALGLASYRAHIGPARLDAQGSLAQQTFNGRTHLNTLSASAALMLPIAGGDRKEVSEWEAGGAISWSGFDYPKLPDYRSHQFELRGRLQYQPNPVSRISSDAGWVVDKALASRPGGDRQGPVAQVAIQWMPAQNHSLEIVRRRTWLHDDQAYSPVFFGETKRANSQALWYGAWRYRLSPEFQLRLEGRYSTSRDALPLFKFNSSSIGFMLEWWPR
jgi:hypothetical protein